MSKHCSARQLTANRQVIEATFILHSLVAPDDRVTRWTRVHRILARIDTERYETTRPTSDDEENSDDDPAQQADFKRHRCDDNITTGWTGELNGRLSDGECSTDNHSRLAYYDDARLLRSRSRTRIITWCTGLCGVLLRWILLWRPWWPSRVLLWWVLLLWRIRRWRCICFDVRRRGTSGMLVVCHGDFQWLVEGRVNVPECTVDNRLPCELREQQSV
jgi:hypothetical protein